MDCVFRFASLRVRGLVVSKRRPVVISTRAFVTGGLDLSTDNFSGTSIRVVGRTNEFIADSVLLPDGVCLSTSFGDISLNTVDTSRRGVSNVLILGSMSGTGIQFRHNPDVVPTTGGQVQCNSRIASCHGCASRILLKFASTLGDVSRSTSRLVEVIRDFSGTRDEILVHTADSCTELLSFSLRPDYVRSHHRYSGVFRGLFTVPSVSPRVCLTRCCSVSRKSIPCFAAPVGSASVISSLNGRVNDMFRRDTRDIIVHRLHANVSPSSVSTRGALVHVGINSTSRNCFTGVLRSRSRAFSRGGGREGTLTIFGGTVFRVTSVNISSSIRSSVSGSVS